MVLVKIFTRLDAACFHISTLTTPSNRNPQGVTMPRDLRPVAAGTVEVARATFIFPLSTVWAPTRDAPTLH